MVLPLNLCKRGLIAACGIPTACEKGEERKQNEYDPEVHLRSCSIFIEKVAEKRKSSQQMIIGKWAKLADLERYSCVRNR